MSTSSPRATRRPLDVSSTGAAAVPIQLDHVAWLDVGQLSERQVEPAELDRQGHRHVERTSRCRRRRCGGVPRQVRLTHAHRIDLL